MRQRGARVQGEKKREDKSVRGDGRNGLVRKQRIVSAHVSAAHASSPHKALAHTCVCGGQLELLFNRKSCIKSCRACVFCTPCVRCS